MEETAVLVRHYLLYFILPLWIIAGLGDYAMHRRTRIEETSGTKESVLHILQLVQIGVPILLGLLLEVNALVLLVMLIGLLAHEATALWDLHYTTGLREIRPLEQHVHSFMEVLPLMAVSFVSMLYWDQLQSLFGIGPEPARWDLRPKSDPLPTGYLLSLLGAVGFFIVLPFGEELWRCIRAARRRPSLERRRSLAA
jgi:hypothetical protein